MRAFLLVVFLVFGAQAESKHSPPSPSPRPSPSPASRVTRDFSNSWNYNVLQQKILESQRDKINSEINRLISERRQLTDQAKVQYQIDLAAGDDFDERTLEIKRR